MSIDFPRFFVNILLFATAKTENETKGSPSSSPLLLFPLCPIDNDGGLMYNNSDYVVIWEGYDVIIHLQRGTLRY